MDVRVGGGEEAVAAVLPTIATDLTRDVQPLLHGGLAAPLVWPPLYASVLHVSQVAHQSVQIRYPLFYII
jgi:hypothetical protein